MNDEVSNYCEKLSAEKNVGSDERWLSMFGSGVLLTAGLMRGSPLFLAGAVGLGFRALTGYCPVYGAIGANRTQPARSRLILDDQQKTKFEGKSKVAAHTNSK